MTKGLIKLSALLFLAFITGTANADSFLSPKDDHIIPLIYVEDMEYYNHKTTKAYTQKITDKLSLMPEITVTNNKDLADYILYPKLLQSQIEQINSANNRYNMSIAVELQTKNGNTVTREQKNRYIIIESAKNPQEIAKKLMQKLLEEALNDLSAEIKNSRI